MKLTLLGHRGMGPTSRTYVNQFLPSGVIPENSLMAFQTAFDKGADGVELDVYLTLDNEVVVSRDDILDRNVDGFHSCWDAGETPVLGKISDRTFAELQSPKYDLGCNQFIPSLRSVIDLAISNNKMRENNLIVNIELQGENVLVAKYTWNIIREYVANPDNNLQYCDFIVNSFNLKLLIAFREAQALEGFEDKVELLIGVNTFNMFGKEALLPNWIPVVLRDAKPLLEAGVPVPKDKVDSLYIHELIANCKKYGINNLDIIGLDVRANLLDICSETGFGLSLANNGIRCRAEYEMWHKDARKDISDIDLELMHLQHMYMLLLNHPTLRFFYKCDHLQETIVMLNRMDELFAPSENIEPLLVNTKPTLVFRQTSGIEKGVEDSIGKMGCAL